MAWSRIDKPWTTMIEYKQIIHKAFSGRAHFTWDGTGKIATVHFLTEDETAIVLTMPEATLALLREDIVHALANKQQPNLDH